MSIRTEICIDSVEGVLAAKEAGANGVELCSALLEGGLTPSYGLVKRAVAVSGNVDIQVMIRPRGGDFLYTEEEFCAMKEDIMALKCLGVEGFVFGLLDADGSVDISRTAELIELSRPVAVTFHRAIDMAYDPLSALDTLIDLGVERILTSGHSPNALEGAPVIHQMVKRAKGRIRIMAGCGITPNNVVRILDETGVNEIHFSAFEKQAGPMLYRNNRVSMGGTLRPPEFDRSVTSTDRIDGILSAIE
ncbi:copper homeostasis protein CutC [Lentilitoribacter sp. EG35]|uniref:copper homeostasis protein CutC n=1 Tax=Lentilitoribacter sp. EG35 TaxID=3234192 RepID=UPI003460CA17